MTVTVDTAIADLKAQFEKAVTDQRGRVGGETVQVQRPAEGHWVFRLRTRGSVAFRLGPPRSLWLANKRIRAKAPDLCVVGATYQGESLIVFVEAKQVGANASRRPEIDWYSLSQPGVRSDFFSDPMRQVAATRSVRALLRILKDGAADAIKEAAGQSSDLAVVVRALEQPEAIEALEVEDPFAAAKLRGVRERERLLSEEGGTWSVEQVARHLHLTRQAVNRRRKQGTLLGLGAGRHGFRYPAWQFTRKGTVEGLERVLASLKDLDPWMQQAFMLSKNARLKDKRALDIVREGDVSSVLKAASAFGEHGGS